MNLKTVYDIALYMGNQIKNHHHKEISFSSPVHQLDIQSVYQRIINANPELLLCVETIKGSGQCLGLWNHFNMEIEYSDVFPSFVTCVDSKRQVLDSLLRAVTLHSKRDFLVCKDSNLDMALDTVKNVTSMPDYLNHYLKGVSSIVKKRSETGYCGLEVTLFYSCDYKTLKTRERQVNERIDEIIKLSSQAGSEDWKQAISVVDYCVRHWSYSRGAGDGLEFTAYGALVQNKAVCMGFSLALCAIFKRLCIPCRYICGRKNGEGHAWNLIYLKGGWFYIDLTDAIGARDPLYHWGVTSFSDGRTIETQCDEELVCNCPKEFIRHNI